MTLMKTHNSSMKMHDRKLHSLLSIEYFRRFVIVYEFHQKGALEFSFQAEEISFTRMFPAKIWKNIKL